MKDNVSSSHVILAKGAAIFLAGRGIGRFFSLAFQATLAHLLAPASFGVFALGWTGFRLVEAIGPFGLQAGVLRFTSATAAADPSSARPTVFRATRLALASGITLGACTFFSAPALAIRVFHMPGAIDILRWFAIGFPFLTVLIVATEATQALQTTRYVAGVREVGQPLLVAILALGAVFLGLGVRGAAAGVVTATALAAGISMVTINRLFPRRALSHRGTSSRVLLAVSLPAGAASTFRLLLSWSDRVVVGVYLPAAGLGAYHAAAQLAAVVSMIAAGFSGILAAMIVSALATGAARRARHLYRTSIRWMLYLATPVLVPLIVAPRDVLVAIFGPAYAGAAASLRVLALGQGLSLLTGTVGVLLVMTGRERRWALLAVISFTTNLGLSLLLTPRWGLLGAATSTAAALAVLTILGIAEASRALGGVCIDWKVVKALLIAGGAVGIGFILLPHLPLSWSLRVMILVFVASMWIVAVLAVIGLDSEEQSLYIAVRSRIMSQTGAAKPRGK